MEPFNGAEACDFVKIHQDRSLLEATKLLHDFGAREAPFAVHVFRRAVKVPSLDRAVDMCRIVLNRVKLIVLSLALTALPGLFINPKVKREVSGNVDAKMRAMKRPPMPAFDFCSFSGIETAYSRILKAITEGRVTPIYGMNLERPSKLIPSYLGKLPLHIDPEMNEALDCSYGINQATYYLAGYASFTEMHPENGYLDSANVMHWGVGENAAKLWLCVHPGDFWLLCKSIAAEVSWLRAQNPDIAASWNVGCSTPLNHKSMILSPELLRRWAVRYEIIVQKPGDLVYVGPAVYHQVVNTDINFAEAVNVGGLLWNVAGNKFINCQCAATAISFVPPNANVAGVIRAKPRILFPCKVKGCRSSFTTLALRLEHHRVHESGEVKSFVCPQCRKVLKNKRNLTRHVSEQHEGNRRTRLSCDVCGIVLMANSLRRHKTNSCKGPR